MSTDDESLICPITHEYFRDPVLADDGHLYEREAITRWISEHGTSPFTRQFLNINHLQPNDEVRKKANHRRRLSVSYNRESDQVQLPPIRTARNVSFNTIIAGRRHSPDPIRRWPNMQNSGGITHSPCNLWKRPNFVACVCIIFCIMAPIIMVSIIYAASRSRPSLTTIPYTSRPLLCNPLNYIVPTNSCIASFTNLTILFSGTCTTFAYRRFQFNIRAESSTTAVIFAFQQTVGVWYIDNITFSNTSSSQNLFRNGDFESGSLSPDYRQCQSTGNISNSRQYNGRYCYSDNTRGQFGYLMQNVSTTAGSSYTLNIYLQNRNGSNSSFVILVGS